MDKERFLNSIAAVSTDSGIGTLGEKTLHSVIKRYIEPNPECREVKVVGRIVADIYNSDGITEIQTRNYFALRKKLPKLLEIAPVTIVLPLPATKWVSWIDPETGDVSKRRKSPKSGRPHDGLYELSKIKDFLSDERLSILILMIDMDEYRNLDGWGNGGKRGSTRNERIPLELVTEYRLSSPEDYRMFVPEWLPSTFTLKNFEKAIKQSHTRATAALYLLRELGIVSLVGKSGRENLYQLTNFSISPSNTSIEQNPASAE